MKKITLKILPYLISISVGFIFYFIGLSVQEKSSGLFINISAAFFAIPLIYLFYQLINSFSHKRLNKAIFDYVKMQVDIEVLSIINQLQKMVYPLKERNHSLEGIDNFLSLKQKEITDIITQNEYLGFQVFKEWQTCEEKFHNILKNPLILQKLEDEQIISLISIIQCVRFLEKIQKVDGLYIKIDKQITSHKIVSGKELNKGNTRYPDRYLLLRNMGEDHFMVEDFGDFPLYDLDKLLQIFRVEEKFIQSLTTAIMDIINEINRWVYLTGGEFIIDTKMFRLEHNQKKTVHVAEQ